MTEGNIKNLKSQIDKVINDYFDEQIKIIKKISPQLVLVYNELKKFNSKGKRWRIIIAYYSYLACGGKERKNFFKYAISLELLHNFLLIHDDIVDRDDLRRGKPTMHKSFSQLNNQHTSLALAIFGADLLNYLAYQNIINSDLKKDIKNKLVTLFTDTVSEVCQGELLDILFSAKKRITEKEVLLSYQKKTASYSMTLPIIFGATMADANQVQIKQLKKSALLLGVVYQIRDDILDIFGQQNKIGKKIGSDIRENKKTILLVKALNQLNVNDKKDLISIMAKDDVSQTEFSSAKKLISKTKALTYCENLCQQYTEKANKLLNKKNFTKHIDDLVEILNKLSVRTK